MRNALVVLVFLLVGCSDDYVDNGMMSSPMFLPWAVVMDETADDTLHQLTEDQCAWWNEELSKDGTVRVVFHFENYSEYPGDTIGVIWVGWGELEDPLGGYFSYIRSVPDNKILRGWVTIEPDMRDRGGLFLSRLVRHELGHALGLADDPLGIDSIMEYKINLFGELTEHDFSLLVDDYDNRDDELP
jgi:hypothetical protein